MEGQGRVRRKSDEFGDLMVLIVGRFNEVSNNVRREVMRQEREV